MFAVGSCPRERPHDRHGGSAAPSVDTPKMPAAKAEVWGGLAENLIRNRNDRGHQRTAEPRLDADAAVDAAQPLAHRRKADAAEVRRRELAGVARTRRGLGDADVLDHQ